MVRDINGITLQIGDMVKFPNDRYTHSLGVIEDITLSDALWVKICGGGGTGNRLILPEHSEKVTELELNGPQST